MTLPPARVSSPAPNSQSRSRDTPCAARVTEILNRRYARWNRSGGSLCVSYRVILLHTARRASHKPWCLERRRRSSFGQRLRSCPVLLLVTVSASRQTTSRKCARRGVCMCVCPVSLDPPTLVFITTQVLGCSLSRQAFWSQHSEIQGPRTLSNILCRHQSAFDRSISAHSSGSHSPRLDRDREQSLPGQATICA